MIVPLRPHVLVLALLGLAPCALAQSPASDRSHSLWYDHPATSWDEGLPIGNGRLGAMDMGGVESDRLQMNEDTLTSGEPPEDLRTIDIRPDFQKVRDLIRSKQYAQADAFITTHWLGRCQQCYEPMADLTLATPASASPVTGYRRWLDMDRAIVGTQWTRDKVVYTRECFASYPDQVIVVHLTASKPGTLSFSASLSTPHPSPQVGVLDGEVVELAAQIPGFVLRRPMEDVEKHHEQSHYPELFTPDGQRRPEAAQILYADKTGGKGMRFDVRIWPKVIGGTVRIDPDGTVSVSRATEALLIVSAGTSFNGFDKSPTREGVDPTLSTRHRLSDARQHSYADLLGRHETDYRALFDRVSLSLPTPKALLSLPIDQRLRLFSGDSDPGLAALLFHFGRYLMIAGSREGGQPTNLQGLWNDELRPPWTCSYTVNINTEMNYWPAEADNLPELAEPLFRMIAETSVTGAGTARNMYGNRGWVAHHNITLWRDSYPVDGAAQASFWNMAGGWLCSHLWEHYLFSGDTQFLADKAYPLMKGAAEFYADWLVPAEDGTLITPISTSPENNFRTAEGVKASVSEGCTMDMTIIRELFTRTIEAQTILGVDPQLKAELSAKLARLSPFRIGARGQLQEWREDFPEMELHHRHMSHLYGLYPGNQITPDFTPELFAAAKKSLLLRGDEATGWAMTWRIALWARALDGDHALAVAKAFIKPARLPGIAKQKGGLYDSLLDACPPFQIDGNYGFTAAVTELLVQSHGGVLALLPALPSEWSQGSVTGLRARGGFVVSIDWSHGKLQRAVIASTKGGVCRIRTASPIVVHGGEPTEATGPNPNPFYEVINPGKPRIDPKSPPLEVVEPTGYTVDVDTRPGQTLVIGPVPPPARL